MDNPLSIIFEEKVFVDGSKIHLGKIETDNDEGKDTHVFRFKLVNSGPKYLTDFKEVTNMPSDAYSIALPSEIEPLGNKEAILNIRASKLFKLPIDKIEFGILFAEVKKV